MNITRDDAALRPRRRMRAAFLASGVLLGAGLPASAAEGVASFYGGREHGGPTASGERFNMHAMTAAHRTAPLGSHLKVTNLTNGRSVVVRINDRGPFVRGRIIDLSRAAADRLGFVSSGLTRVSVETASGEAVASTDTAPADEPKTTASTPAKKQAAARGTGEVKVALDERDLFLLQRGRAN
jgi:rare lipoprotein A